MGATARWHNVYIQYVVTNQSEMTIKIRRYAAVGHTPQSVKGLLGKINGIVFPNRMAGSCGISKGHSTLEAISRSQLEGDKYR